MISSSSGGSHGICVGRRGGGGRGGGICSSSGGSHGISVGGLIRACVLQASQHSDLH